MDNIIEDIKPGQVVAAIDTAYLELDEYLSLLAKADRYRRTHSGLENLLSRIEKQGALLLRQER